MSEFIGRKRELETMNNLYNRSGFQMTVMYGRRRVGKSTLLQHFIEGKKAIFYTAVRTSPQRNLELLGARVIEALAPDLKEFSFKSYDQLFSFLGEKCKDERIVFILDEFPYMAESDKYLLSVLQKYIDTSWLNGNMYLFICGSSVSFMEDEVLSEKSPLFGRRTSQIALKPFDYRESALFVPDYSSEEKAIVYGVTGGIAKYLSLFDKKLSLDENLIELFFSNHGYMYEEPVNLLSQEFRNISSYSAVIEAIASGRTRLNEIADLTKIDASTVSHAIKNLVETGILKKEFAITEENNKKKIRYSLSDHMFRFWFQFIAPYMDVISLGEGRLHYENIVKPRISQYMGEVFEDMCRYYTLLLGVKNKLPCLITKTGKWWGTNPNKKEETDIDVVGLDLINKNAVLGECKFKNELLDKKVFESLKERLGLIDSRYKTVKFLLFSKSGFSDWIIENKDKEDIITIDLNKMYSNDLSL